MRQLKRRIILAFFEEQDGFTSDACFLRQLLLCEVLFFPQFFDACFEGDGLFSFEVVVNKRCRKAQQCGYGYGGGNPQEDIRCLEKSDV